MIRSRPLDGNTADDDGCSSDCGIYKDTTGLDIYGVAYDITRDNGGATEYVAVTSIGADLTGAVHIIAQRWEDGLSQSPVVYFRKPISGAWSTPTIVQSHPPPDPGINTVSFGDLFVTTNGDVHHTFMTYNLQQIWYEVKRSGATGFGEPSLAGPMNNDETTGYENPWPVMAVDTHGRVFTAWAENRGGSSIPNVVLSVFDGTTWAPHDVTTTADINVNSAPAMTAVDDLIYLLYRDSGGELILVNYRYAPP